MKKLSREKLESEMAERLFFALNHWKYSGGLVMNHKTGKAITPMRYFADGLAMLGIEISKEDVDALAKPLKERRKYFADRRRAKRQERAGK